jgi:hypothetical protein
MRKTLLSLAIISLSPFVAAEQYNGRLSGMSGAGYVTGGYSDGVLLNSSLGATQGKEDDFAFVINGGALGSDKDNLVDSMDDLVDYIDVLDDALDQNDLTSDMAEELIGHLENVADKQIQVGAAGSLVIAIPNDVVSIALIAKAHGALGAATLIDEDDYELIRNAVNEPFDLDDLQSSAVGRGTYIREVGVSFSKAVAESENRQLLVGITPKKISVETIIYEALVADYDEDDFEADDYSVESSATGLDAGVTFIDGNLRYGLSISDLISNEFKTITNETFELEPKSTAALGYVKEWLTAEIAMDLNATESYGLGLTTQILRAGVELKPLSWLQLRAGLQQDLENTLPDTYSIGFGLSPFDVVNLDIAAYTGKNETVGGALQLGLRF